MNIHVKKNTYIVLSTVGLRWLAAYMETFKTN